MKEEIAVLLDEYEEHMKLHRMKVNKGTTETMITVAGKVAEDFVKLKWGEQCEITLHPQRAENQSARS